jgi:predicted 2-oxoglutarate/Fe(II)-dependent dioxygenase YbiX
MHTDKAQTHVISCILHIDSSEDAEPWPIVIEDFQGNTNEVILTSGDLLFYESSKCLHGRPKTFNGSWYSSIFVHYHPTGEWNVSILLS